MAEQQIAKALGIGEGADISDTASIVMKKIRQYIAASKASGDVSKASVENATLEKFYNVFFTQSSSWANLQKAKMSHIETHPDTQSLRKAAKPMKEKLKKRLLDAGLCVMQLDRVEGYMRKQVDAYVAEAGQGQKMQWSSDSDKILEKYVTEYHALVASNAELSKAVAALEDIDGSLDALPGDVQTKVLRHLRSRDFDKAKDVVSGAKDDARTAAQTYIHAVEAKQAVLVGRDEKLYASLKEPRLIMDNQTKEIEQKKDYIAKYTKPFMEHKIDQIDHLKNKLTLVGSLDHLMTLYVQLVRGLVEPFQGLPEVREYEANVLNKIKHMLDAQFQEIDVIFERQKEILDLFDERMHQIRQVK